MGTPEKNLKASTERNLSASDNPGAAAGVAVPPTSSPNCHNTSSSFERRRPQSVTLEKDKVYGFIGSTIGCFRIRGGATGNIWVHGERVSVINPEGKVIFTTGEDENPHDLVTVQDSWNGTTKVRLIKGQPKTAETVGKHWSSILQGHQQQGPLQVVGVPGEEIILRGGTGRSVVITGPGGKLKSVGGAKVTVCGSLDSVCHAGRGQLYLKGRISGSVSLRGRGSLYLLGDVGGNIVSQSTRLLQVYGKIAGGVEQYSGGGIVTHSNIKGDVTQQGRGTLIIQGSVGGDITQTGSGAVTLIGDHQGKIYQLGRGFIYRQQIDPETGITTFDIHHKQS